MVASVAQKQGYLQRVLANWGPVLQPVRSVGEDRRFGYRDRVTLNARWDALAGWRFGMMRRDELIPIHDCPVHSARVNRLVALLRGWSRSTCVWPSGSTARSPPESATLGWSVPSTSSHALPRTM